MTATAERIKDIAEKHIRSRGYNDFSFREIAAEIGIKSASVHYHFRTKGDLGAAVARRYTERFMQHLQQAEEEGRSVVQLLEEYIALFRRSLVDEKRVCLCGMLGAEVDSLPDEVVEETRRFFEENLKWLQGIVSRQAGVDEASAVSQARHLLAALEGGMIVARTLQDISIFESVAHTVSAQTKERGSD